MIAIAANPETGESLEVDLGDIEASDFDAIQAHSSAKNQLLSYLDNLSVSADTKAMLHSLVTKVIKVGQVIIRIGQRVLEVIVNIVRAFPNASFGLVFGAVAGVLIGTVPLLGAVLGPIVTPILAAYALLSGMQRDFQNAALSKKIKEGLDVFEPLKGTIA